MLPPGGFDGHEKRVSEKFFPIVLRVVCSLIFLGLLCFCLAAIDMHSDLPKTTLDLICRMGENGSH